MARTVIAIYESVYTAKQAIWELKDLGFPRDRIDMVTGRLMDNANDLAKPEAARSEMVVNELRAGVGIGAGIGGSLGIVGGLLASVGELHISLPVAAGPWHAVAIVCAMIAVAMAAGCILGSLISGFIGLGIPEDEVRSYAKNVRKDSVTVMVVADWDAIDGTIEVLGHYNPLEIRQKTIEWQKAGARERKLAERALHIKATEQDRPR